MVGTALITGHQPADRTAVERGYIDADVIDRKVALLAMVTFPEIAE